MQEITIKHRYNDRVLICGKYESVKDCLEKNRGADLQGAYLRGADLQGAYLQGADLQGAYLQGADLQEPLFLPDLYSLKLLPPETKLRFWKYLENGQSPYKHFVYDIGKEYIFDDACTDERQSCAPGGNVATLVWCLKDSNTADEFMEVEFTVADIAAIPYSTDGKFRASKYTTLRIINREQATKLLTDSMNPE